MSTIKNGARVWWAFAVAVVIAGLFLFSNHRTHILALLSYAFVLACPLMHFVGHGSHGKRAGSSHN